MLADPRNPLLVCERREACPARKERAPSLAEIVDARTAETANQSLVTAVVGHAGGHHVVPIVGGDALSQGLLAQELIAASCSRASLQGATAMFAEMDVIPIPAVLPGFRLPLELPALVG